ncbi:MAG: hypothetical protein H7X71_04840 [Chitinophagales bacterium]|nr:hypothetical protein [Chitinophagales bacterium]
MKKQTTIWLAVGIAFIIALVYYLFTLLPENYDWTETYYINQDQPFSTEVLADLMKEYFEEKKFTVVRNKLIQVLEDDADEHRNYMFAGNTFFMDDSTCTTFINFISKGNDAFIAANRLSDDVCEHLFNVDQEEDYGNDPPTIYPDDSTTISFLPEEDITENNTIIEYLPAEKIELHLKKENLSNTYAYQIRDKNESYDWNYIPNDFINSGSRQYPLTSIGEIKETGTNFARIQIGKGNIYILTTPIVLTNFYLIKEENLPYTSHLFSYLKEGDIIWDEYSKNNHFTEEGMEETEGPLQFILSQTALRWGWYTMLAGVLIFMVFRSKRMQQTIPITEPNINKSLEFIQSIGRMYYLRNDQKQLVQQQMKLFIQFVKEKYRINIQTVNDEKIQKLSLKSQISIEEIEMIIQTYQELELSGMITDKQLMHFHSLTENFYQRCK